MYNMKISNCFFQYNIDYSFYIYDVMILLDRFNDSNIFYVFLRVKYNRYLIVFYYEKNNNDDIENINIFKKDFLKAFVNKKEFSYDCTYSNDTCISFDSSYTYSNDIIKTNVTFENHYRDEMIKRVFVSNVLDGLFNGIHELTNLNNITNEHIENCLCSNKYYNLLSRRDIKDLYLIFKNFKNYNVHEIEKYYKNIYCDDVYKCVLDELKQNKRIEKYFSFKKGEKLKFYCFHKKEQGLAYIMKDHDFEDKDYSFL